VTHPPSALITGASRGIGYGIARHLAELGWALTLNARDEVRLLEVQTELSGLGGRVQIAVGDMADELFPDSLVRQHAKAYQVMNALVLAAGVGTSAPLEGYPLHRFDKQFSVNVRAPFALISKAIPLLRAAATEDRDRGGRIIALSSLESQFPGNGLSAYGASKAALTSLIRSVNIEQNPYGITASAIAPAFVDTDMSAWTAESIDSASMIRVEDVVKVVDLILSLSPNAVVSEFVIDRVGAEPYQA
jgi:3-oxoacyl-[acyl-carrier protein] reductase